MRLLKSLSAAAGQALDAVNGVLSGTSDQVDAVVAEFSQQANQLTGQLGDALSSAGDSAGGLAAQLQSAVSGVAGGAGQMAGQAQSAVTDALGGADSLFSQATESVDQLGDQLGGSLNGLAADAADQIDSLAAGAKDQIADVAAKAGSAADELIAWGSNCVDGLVSKAKNLINTGQRMSRAAIQQAQSAIVGGFKTARSAALQEIENVANLVKAVYVNAGAWGAGGSSFVLVAGRYVVVCSWLGSGTHLCELKAESDEDRPAIQRILQFLEAGRGRGEANPTMLCYDTTLTPLVEDGAENMLVFIGDLHIHLFPVSPFDGFTKGVGSQKQSLIGDLAQLLRHARDQGVPATNVIQVGDCFDVWEAQIIMDVLCDVYVAVGGAAPRPLAQKIQPLLDAAKNIPNIWKPLTDNLGAAPNNEAAIRQSFLQLATPRAVAEIVIGADYARRLPRRPVLDQPLDFTDATAVEECIKGAYEDIWDLFTPVRGNHDNDLPNEQLRAKYGRTAGGADRNGPPSSRECGRSNCVVVEHGDVLDAFNNKQDYDQPNQGFSMTRAFVLYEWIKAVKSTWGAAIWNSGGSQAGGAEESEGGDDPSLTLLQEFARSRAFDIRTGHVTSSAARKYRLIVLGHSHLPEITPDRMLDEALAVGRQGGSRLLCPWLADQAGDFFEGLPIQV